MGAGVPQILGPISPFTGAAALPWALPCSPLSPQSTGRPEASSLSTPTAPTPGSPGSPSQAEHLHEMKDLAPGCGCPIYPCHGDARCSFPFYLSHTSISEPQGCSSSLPRISSILSHQQLPSLTARRAEVESSQHPCALQQGQFSPEINS